MRRPDNASNARAPHPRAQPEGEDSFMNCSSCFPQPFADPAAVYGGAGYGETAYGEAVQTIQPMTPGAAPQAAPSMPMGTTGLTPILPGSEPPAQTLVGNQYLNGALRTQIGNRITVSYLIGTNTFMGRTGVLLAVGANYIVMREAETDDILFSDFYSIKFVRVYH